MTVKFKKDQEILNKYLNGSTIKTAFQTPLKNVRGYVTDDNRALFIVTKTQRDKAPILISLVAVQKGWNSSIHTEGSDLVCLLYP